MAGNKEGIKDYLIPQEIKWRFNPTAARDFERGMRLVKSCKKAMIVVLGNKSVLEDVLSTTMCFVEQTLDARPLTPVSSGVIELEALTLITS